MSQLRILTLGPPALHHGDGVLRLPTRKALALLIYLAVEGGRHSREHLASLLWPDLDAPRGRAALRNTLSYYRAALEASDSTQSQQPHLLVERDRIEVDLTSDIDLDVHALQSSASLPAEPISMPAEQLRRQLSSGAERYRGPFLAGFTLDDSLEFEGWTRVQRERSHRQLSQILDRLSALDLETAAVAAARDVASHWVAHAPADEAAYRRLMEACIAAGDRSEALRVYGTCQRVLLEELDVEPSPETKALAERIRSDARGINDRSPAVRADNLASAVRLTPTMTDVPLLGRGKELEALTAAYFRVCRGQTEVVCVLGEAGIGKTRLSLEFLRWCRARGADVLSGRTFETGGRVPYQPLADLLSRRLERENAPDDLVSNVWLTELSRLLPDLCDRYPDLPVPTADEGAARVRLFEAVARLGQALATRAPVVLFVDDLHWADSASLDLLHFLARRWSEANAPVLFLLTARTESLASEPTLVTWLTDVGRDIRLEQRTLGPMSAEETLRLVESAGIGGNAAALARSLHAETQGQPFYTLETIKALIERGTLVPDSGTDVGRYHYVTLATVDAATLRGILPASVRQVIGSRLAQLSSAATSLLVAGAVLGQEFTFSQLRAVSDIGDAEALPALDILLQRRLVQEMAGHGTLGAASYAFSHDKVRDVVYTEAGDARRRIFHRRAIDVLEQAGSPAAELANHAFAAGIPDRAFRFSARAGDDALRLSAARVAIAHFERALRVADEVSGTRPASMSNGESDGAIDPTLLGHIYVRLGRARELAGDRPGARSTYETLLRLSQETAQPTAECVALNRLATLTAQEASNPNAAVTLLDQALTVAEAAGDRLGLAETEWNLAQLGVYRPDPAATFAHGRRALGLARELGALDLVGRSLNALAYAAKYIGHFEEGETSASEAAAIYRRLGDRAMEVDSLAQAANAQVMSGRLLEGIATGRAAHQISREIENPWGQVSSAYHLTPGLVDAGKYAEALRVARRGAEIARELGAPPLLMYSLNQLGVVARAVMRLEDAEAAHREAFALTAPLPPLFRERSAVELCADYAIKGQWSNAADYARQALDARSDVLLNTGLTRWYEIEALVRADDVALAERDVQHFAEQISANRRFQIPLLRSQAVLANAKGQTAEAIELLERSAEVARAIGLPGELWSIEGALARFYRAAGDHVRVGEAIDRGATTLETLAEELDDPALQTFFIAEATRLVLSLSRQ